MKTAELEGVQLDLFVAKALGRMFEGRYLDEWVDQRGVSRPSILAGEESEDFEPSSNWAHGGPIIEREGIHLFTYEIPEGVDFQGRQGPCTGWAAHNAAWKPDAIPGATPLVAAMRAFVASKLGESVEAS